MKIGTVYLTFSNKNNKKDMCIHTLYIKINLKSESKMKKSYLKPTYFTIPLTNTCEGIIFCGNKFDQFSLTKTEEI